MDLLIWKGDDVDYIYEFDTGDQKREAVLDIIERRLAYGYFYEEDEDRAKKILETEDYNEGMRFLRDRRDHEYESIMITATMNVQ